MKTIEQIQKEIPYGDVYLSNQFRLDAEDGYFIPYEGVGYFHDGENETDYCVWDVKQEIEFNKYPYVVWYIK